MFSRFIYLISAFTYSRVYSAPHQLATSERVHVSIRSLPPEPTAASVIFIVLASPGILACIPALVWVSLKSRIVCIRENDVVMVINEIIGTLFLFSSVLVRSIPTLPESQFVSQCLEMNGFNLGNPHFDLQYSPRNC